MALRKEDINAVRAIPWNSKILVKNKKFIFTRDRFEGGVRGFSQFSILPNLANLATFRHKSTKNVKNQHFWLKMWQFSKLFGYFGDENWPLFDLAPFLFWPPTLLYSIPDLYNSCNFYKDRNYDIKIHYRPCLPPLRPESLKSNPPPLFGPKKSQNIQCLRGKFFF